MAAEEDEIFESGLSSVCPVMQVVGVAPVGVSVARGEDASDVSSADCGSEGRGDQSSGSPHVQGLGHGIEDDPGQIGVAGDSVDLVSGEKRPVAGL